MESQRVADWWEAPDDLLAVDGHCGLLAAWMILAGRGRTPSVVELAKACRYTARHGIFTVSLAAAFTELGFTAKFYSDPDPNVGAFERRCYARAKRLGVTMLPAISVKQLLNEVQQGRHSIVLLDTDADVGHFSPLLGEADGKLQLPLAEHGSLSHDEILSRWSGPGILRQCVVIE